MRIIGEAGLAGGRILVAVGLGCAALASVVLPQSAHAAALSADSRTVTVDVRARIASRCGIKENTHDQIDASQDLENPARLTLRVGLDCNTPYAFGVTATHGALVNLDASDDGSGYAFRKAYGLSVVLNTDKGVVRSARCLSADLVRGGKCAFAGDVAGDGLNSGGGISIDRDAVLTIDWPSQSTLPRRLAPGHYRDTLTIIVGANA